VLKEIQISELVIKKAHKLDCITSIVQMPENFGHFFLLIHLY